jgi:hypothetical protein
VVDFLVTTDKFSAERGYQYGTIQADMALSEEA